MIVYHNFGFKSCLVSQSLDLWVGIAKKIVMDTPTRFDGKYRVEQEGDEDGGSINPWLVWEFEYFIVIIIVYIVIIHYQIVKSR